MRRRRKIHWRRWCILAAAAGAAVHAVSVLRPQFLAYAEDRVRETVSYALYDVLSENIYDRRSEYAALVMLERDSGSGVTALRTDSILMNRLKVDAARAVYDAVQELSDESVSIPLGSVLLPSFLSGRGPALEIGMVGLGYADAEFLSAFTSAGINQTRHQVILEVRAEIKLLSLLGTRTVDVCSSLAVSDTVLVGNTPEQYTYIDDTEQGVLGKVVDYGMNGD
ncbi:MAG: hypothetical protein IKM54_04165 [Butyricicoccus sp.]|nr:hypothetical protein [Butyricicoccus sp.]